MNEPSRVDMIFEFYGWDSLHCVALHSVMNAYVVGSGILFHCYAYSCFCETFTEFRMIGLVRDGWVQLFEMMLLVGTLVFAESAILDALVHDCTAC